MMLLFYRRKPDLLKAISTGESNFIVWATHQVIEICFNEIAPHTGTAMLDSSTIVLTISAEGDWSLDVTARYYFLYVLVWLLVIQFIIYKNLQRLMVGKFGTKCILPTMLPAPTP